MHTMFVEGWFVNHNADFSGNIHLHRSSPSGSVDAVAIPMDVLEAVVAEKIRRDRIARLEDALPKDILK